VVRCGCFPVRRVPRALHREQIELLRALCAVVFDGADASDDLLKRSVDFIEGGLEP